MRTTLTRTEPHALDLLGGDPGAPALVTPAASVDYAELADRVAARRAELGTGRRLVFLSGSNTAETVVTYLAALAGGHPLLFTQPDAAGGSALEDLVARYAPDVVVRVGADDEVELDRLRDESRHVFHRDLALLASTSGSTGSPKLVRLSQGNVLANARAIADYLQLTPEDRAATTLPLHYCYGLSVVNSHLVAGGSLLLTDRSVVEPTFWAEFDAHEATSIAGVPYTYELLEATDFAQRPHPSLRYVTQAGGRMDPERVRGLARLGRERGFEVVVMYGQTEATARMAYLPAELAETAAGAIGVPVPGGSFRIDERVGGAPGEGELVYTGPNVMMGYAETAADLGRGAEVDELRTGDLARRRDDGLYEITGRLSRFVKAFGLRLDLDLIGVCLDTCHLAVSFADPAEAVERIAAAGLRVVKVQASAALHVERPADADARRAVGAYAEDRYLHQVREDAPGGVIRVDDLPEALAELPATAPWRVHFHVPLHLVPEPPLASTTDVLRTALAAVRAVQDVDQVHLDVETYTWSVLPGAPVDLVDGIAAELRWAHAELLEGAEQPA